MSCAMYLLFCVFGINHINSRLIVYVKCLMSVIVSVVKSALMTLTSDNIKDSMISDKS